MSYPIQKDPTWDIIDGSKLKDYIDCPRMFFFRHLLGWVSDSPNNHLVFGSAWHDAMEHLLLNGYGNNSVIEAFEKFLTTYRKEFPEETDELYAPKTPERVLEALAKYAEEYRDDDFEVLYTEIGGTVPLDERSVMYFRQDTICRDHTGIFSLEHKTLGKSVTRAWEQQWPLSIQVGTYAHALYCLFPEEEVYGVKMNACGIMKTKFDFKRIPIRKTFDSMQAWLWNTLYWLDRLYTDFDELEQSSEFDPVMTSFPMKTTACSNYFGCPYHDFCLAWNNPLQRCGEVPYGLKQTYWNPLDRPVKLKLEKGEKIEQENYEERHGSGNRGGEEEKLGPDGGGTGFNERESGTEGRPLRNELSDKAHRERF